MIEKWMYQYPSTVLTRLIRGDVDYAGKFRGEADKLLWQLKNLIQFNNLGRLDMKRVFTDGTIIRVKSVFGHDTIEIDVSRALPIAEEELLCIITLIDVSHFVQPMRYPGEIHEGEIENKDYLKIYYTVDLINCFGCGDPFFEVTVDDCTWSLENSCSGEIVSKGDDEQGTYIIVKFFTESADYSRTGLSDMILKSWIIKPDGTEACSTEEEIKVDCCEKDTDDRAVEIWWEDFGTCTPFIAYSGIQYNAICKMPETTLSQGELRWYSMSFPYDRAPLYAIPEIKGGCIPFEWELSGSGTLYIPDAPDGIQTGAYYVVSRESDCHDTTKITLRDRCGTEYIVQTVDNCEDAEPLVIGYTSLQMQCNDSQNLSVSGGIGPYTWSLSGGGTLTGTNPSLTGAISYQSPGSNAGCTQNPTITVTDCCGSTEDITIAVNCYTGDEVALRLCLTETCTHDCEKGELGFCHYHGIWGRWDYRCDNAILYQAFWDYPSHQIASYDCALASYASGCGKDSGGCANCGNDPSASCDSSCQECCYAGYCPEATCGVNDKRTVAMIAAGCCPLNPLTGLPYTG